jgi:hypothetical protein|tara:strand:+ start:936 stop:1154 length:219 start_codon:yes stop_codon:yes gene_type:complete
MENQFITLNEIKLYGESKSSSPITVNKNHIIKVAPDGAEHSRVEMSKGAGTLLVAEDYKTIYQQLTGKVFLG